LQRRHVYDNPAPVRRVVANGHPLADKQGELDLRYPVRVAELLSPSHFREAPRLRAARGGLVQIGQLLAELDRLTVFESHGNSHLRYPAIGAGGLAVDHHPLHGGSLTDEPFTLGRTHLLLVLVMMQQLPNSPRWILEQKE
jgi:hypothetical protein